MNQTLATNAASSLEERRENGLGLIMIGFLLWFFDALMFFFMPQAARMGHPRPFLALIGAAFVAGAALIAIGTRLRKPQS
jgi:lipopolysaccharide export LptBFGC system permease protein LptF